MEATDQHCAEGNNVLIVFLRAPRPGMVKTRLAAVMGPEEAAQAYRTLVARVLERIADIRPVELHFSPEDALGEVRPWLRSEWNARSQSSGDLGARMCAAFDQAFVRGATRVVLIGSDCPEVCANDIHAAWNELDGHDVVLGPATDGGYWLIGLRASHPELFDGVHWGTSSVLRETLTLATEAGLRTCLLRELADVDTAEDWLAFCRARGSSGTGHSVKVV